MSPHKLFPLTYNGNVLGLSFSYPEELDAFRQVMEKMAARIAKNKPRERPMYDFTFDTNLEMEVAGYYRESLRKILGLQYLSIVDKDQVAIVPLPAAR